MSTLNYTQYGLSPSFDLGLSDDATVVPFRVTLEVVDEQISLHYEVVDGKDLDHIPTTCDSKVRSNW